MDKEGTALVTGASSGIGKAFAEALAKRGYDLVLVARRRKLLETLADEVSSASGIKAEVLTADLASEEDTVRVAKLIETVDGLSMLVNNAGYGIEDPFAESDIESQVDMVHVHNLAPMRLIRAALPGMITNRRGAIINVASGAGLYPYPDYSIYSASKAFLINFTESLHLELLDSDVRVQVLCPGLTHTGFHDEIDTSYIPKLMWMSADDVVEESLEALERGKVVFIPGWRNRSLKPLLLLPRPALYWLLSRFPFMLRKNRTGR